jgi:predicted deacylase
MRTQTHFLPGSTLDNSRSLQSLHFGAGSAPGKVYIQAALHADEIPGLLVGWHLRQQLAELEAAGKIPGEIVLVPVANPLGLAQAIQGQRFGRFDLASGINFNRGYHHLVPRLKETLVGQLGADPQANMRIVRQHALTLLAEWPTWNDADSLKKILQTLAIDADIVLDLHCDSEAVLHLYTGTPLVDAVQPLACLMGAEALLLAKESGGDPFDETCSRIWWELAEHFGAEFPLPLACVAVTVELRGELDVKHELASGDAHNIIAYLAHQGHVLQKGDPLPAPRCQPTPLEGMEFLRAPHAGILLLQKTPGTQVQAGEVIAELIDPQNNIRSEINTPVAGLMFAHSVSRFMHRGMIMATIAGTEVLRSGSLLAP